MLQVYHEHDVCKEYDNRVNQGRRRDAGLKLKQGISLLNIITQNKA